MPRLSHNWSAIAATALVAGSLAVAPALAAGSGKTASPAAPAAKTDAANPTSKDAPEGPKVTTQTIGDWVMECYDPAVNGVNCQMAQRIVQKDSSRNILVVSLAYSPSQKANVIQYVLPLDFLLTPGVAIQVGDYQSVAHVTRCATQGCYIEGTTDDKFIAAMKAATEDARVVIVARTGQKIGIRFSASGFTKAYDEMVQENNSLSAKAAAAKK